jgi:2-polyprenyl-3-methyl-5-hydroxy-6-metoxy-1,4-benzoquinol methylase
MPQDRSDPFSSDAFDHGSDPRFYAHYERESLSDATLARFRTTKDKLLALAASHGIATEALGVVDIGCGAGTQSRLWAEAGHHVHGVDVNAPLIDLARQRAKDAGLAIRFDVGTATALPYENGSMDVCLLPELLEHVADWESCLNEAIRVLRPRGLLYLSTTNVLCPVQQEFNLPFYSWYPGFIKRKVEHLAVTTRPELANHARYPAVHWFSYVQLSSYLSARGVQCFDRFDMIDVTGLSAVARAAVAAARAVPPLRFLGHALTEGTVVFGIKRLAT